MPIFNFLNYQSPRQAKIADHDPVIFDEFLVWNIMMQGSYNPAKQRYNNGMLLENESQAEYQQRLVNIVHTIAEICHLNPQIHIIALEEAPIKPDDIQVFIEEFNKMDSLTKFNSFISADCFTVMGIVTIINPHQYHITRIASVLPTPSLTHRLQEFELVDKYSLQRHYVTNLHMPFDLAKNFKGMALLVNFTTQLLAYNQAGLNSHSLLGDFNFNPTFLFKMFNRLNGYVPKNNNTLVEISNTRITTVFDTVDAALTTKQLIDRPLRDASSLSFFFHRIKADNEKFSLSDEALSPLVLR